MTCCRDPDRFMSALRSIAEVKVITPCGREVPEGDMERLAIAPFQSAGCREVTRNSGAPDMFLQIVDRKHSDGALRGH